MNSLQDKKGGALCRTKLLQACCCRLPEQRQAQGVSFL